MILLQLDPLSRPVAISEIVLLLAGAALIGWLLGRWIMAVRLDALRESIDERRNELDFCRTSQTVRMSSIGVTSATSNPAFATAANRKAMADDLTVVEGIGDQIGALLHEHGVQTFADLASAKPEYLAMLLKKAGSKFQMHDPGTWPAQAALARDQNWEALDEMQNKLKGGRK